MNVVEFKQGQGQWMMRKDRSGALFKPCDPCALQAYPAGWQHRLPVRYRFSGATCAHFKQYNPCVVVCGSPEALMHIETAVGKPQRHKDKDEEVWPAVCGLEKCSYCPEDPQTDAASFCIPMTVAAVFQLKQAIAVKDWKSACSILKATSSVAATVAANGLVLDRRLLLVQHSWVAQSGGAFLVALQPLPDGKLKAMLPGGKREVLLTTLQNHCRGGESTEAAAVRELREETGLCVPLSALRSQGVLHGMAFFTVPVEAVGETGTGAAQGRAAPPSPAL